MGPTPSPCKGRVGVGLPPSPDKGRAGVGFPSQQIQLAQNRLPVGIHLADSAHGLQYVVQLALSPHRLKGLFLGPGNDGLRIDNLPIVFAFLS